jgi:DNA-binding MurR/RpiR family transcriptional regulator
MPRQPATLPASAVRRTFRERLDSARDALTAQEQRVATAMAEDGELIYRTITEFATEHDLGYGSVVRTCQKLGYEGFHDLKIQRAGEEAPSEREPAESPPILAEAYQAVADIRAVSSRLALASVEAAAAAIARSRLTVAIGVAGSASVASRIEYRLSRLGIAAIAEVDAHMQRIRAASLGLKDVLIAISFSGATKDVLGAVEVARARRAKVIALTNSERSPLASRADIALVTGMRVDPMRAEVVSLVTTELCIDLLCSRVARVSPDKDAILRTAQAVAGHLL